MIRIRGLTLGRGARTLLDGADAAIAPGERIALIGDNGSGKSTLLAAIAGDLSPDGGDIDVPPMRVARLTQSMPRSASPAWRFVLEADDALMRTEAAVAAAEASGMTGLSALRTKPSDVRYDSPRMVENSAGPSSARSSSRSVCSPSPRTMKSMASDTS